jgi:hypothetical protein
VKSIELANLCADTIGKVSEASTKGLCRTRHPWSSAFPAEDLRRSNARLATLMAAVGEQPATEE